MAWTLAPWAPAEVERREVERRAHAGEAPAAMTLRERNQTSAFSSLAGESRS